MTMPLKNIVLEKIAEAGSLTDSELFKSLSKEGYLIAEDRFNKLLLDLEILGLIKVAWITKDNRRIEAFTVDEEIDEVDKQNKEMAEKDYEASFPGIDND
ncbi:MAG: hypothetical protein KC483_05265 [Nitrosarchaeum sp.]|nr:hypothetical protein [Nitrosarchaeum sp.]MCA9820232.1 hypothetical protein [Nitrosarchaeum sp.]